MITSIQLKGFKGHRDTRVSLGRLTVLVGPNGAGKTSVLQALDQVDEIVNDSPRALSEDMSPQDLRHRGSEGPIVLTERGIKEGQSWQLSVSIPVGREPPSHSISGGYDNNQPSNLEEELLGWNPSLKGAVGPAVFYRFDARRIAAAAHSSEENPTVKEDGGNTSVVLAALKLEREEVFAQVEAELKKVVPQLQRVRIRRIKMGHTDQIGNKIFLDFAGAPDIPAHGASEGTLITLALMTALCSPDRPRVLLLDDIDQSLHPQAQMELMRELKRLLDSFPEVQLVATTHSPYILDELEPENVQVFALRKDGSAACRSLSEHPQAAKMRGALTTGQLWSLDPESRWVIGEG